MMKNNETSRRGFLKGTAGAAGALAIPLCLSQTAETTLTDSVDERAQKAYIEAVLQKNTGRSRKLNGKLVRTFAQRFTQEYGVVDYKALYRGIAGEYKLTRLFVRSAKLSA